MVIRTGTQVKEMAWHETGHAVFAMVNGIKVDSVKLFLDEGLGDTCTIADDKTHRKFMKPMALAGRVWEIRFCGKSIQQVVLEMMAEDSPISDRVRLGNPSEKELFGMVEQVLADTESMVRNPDVVAISNALFERLYDKKVVTRKEIKAMFCKLKNKEN